MPEIIVAHELNNNVERIRYEPFFTKLMCFITVNNCNLSFDILLCKIILFFNTALPFDSFFARETKTQDLPSWLDR